METKANYALIGAFVLAAFIATVAFIAWLSGSQFDQQFDEYEVVFSGPVRGLSVGGEVRYNGLRVGEVTRLSLDPENSGEVVATVEIDAATPVQTNSYARLEPQGLTGLSYIQIFSGGDDFPLQKDLGRGPYIIPGEMSTLDNILDGGSDVVTEANRALIRANALLSDEAIADFQGILANINRLSGRLAEAEVDPKSIQELIDNASNAALDLSRTLRTYDALGKDVQRVVNEDVARVLLEIEGIGADVEKALSEYTDVAVEGELLVVDAREAINRLSTSGLTDLEETTESLRLLVGSLNRISQQLEQSPLAFIVGDDRQVVEIPQ